MSPDNIRVSADALRQLTIALFEKVGTSRADAELMARLLVETDLRGISTHGTFKIPDYVRRMRNGQVNPRPTIRVLNETRTTRVIDGDGGMGHFPCYQGTHWAVQQAKEYGTAAVTTYNHFHFGGAGKYTRIALENDCIGLAISSHRIDLDPERTVLGASGGSPVSVALPSGTEPTLVLDTGATFIDWDEEHFLRDPWPFYKSLGLGAILQGLGGILAGIYKSEYQAPQSRWESNQGGFIAVFDVACFMPVDQFKKEMDRYMREARSMKPLPGEDSAELAGSVEWQRERDYERDGIPITSGHRQALEELAAELDVETTFSQYG